MFRSFFLDARWRLWSWAGTVIIILATWYQVQIDLEVNEWFGQFYNAIQDALADPGSVTERELLMHLLTFARISAVYIAVMASLEFLLRHYVFRWRTAMHEYYTKHWSKVRHIEGASQRIQEDTMRFAQIIERLGVSLLRSVMTFLMFQPLLWELSKKINQVPFIGHVDHVLIYTAILTSVIGTVLLALVGVKLPGLEFNNQKAEAALRKELVLGEDDNSRADPKTMKELFRHVRENYVAMYRHYLYFDTTKWSYLQLSSIVPYVVLAPTLVSGAITLGIMQQVLRAFKRVEGSLHYLIRSWSTIVELMSVFKRLNGFEKEIKRSNTLSSEAEQYAC
ncbi:putative transporter [Endozoicomonas lisbonensis]|uniref:Peptide/bleomycin uptake transporter n=1 Tax=Endozoicomonas lisbonensis TaxID=3120522 RepID=A0ABV2SJU9_9GAMM